MVICLFQNPVEFCVIIADSSSHQHSQRSVLSLSHIAQLEFFAFFFNLPLLMLFIFCHV